ncbi:CTP synthase (glutamine hydrolyzing) [Candidatus Woesearchaeota archaeon]|nr:MAG: CTP synthase (glutamine hydrolyzing) [Candidatus Woesearchaeota archaeon]
MPTKPTWIIITGGVLSGLGKGVAAASIGNLLTPHYRVIPVKCDGYLNVDPGTMNPIEHGEVFVLDDGGEVDMDFGHYERFLGVTCKSSWNLTMGKVFTTVCEKERKGDYLGKTVQFIPHVTDTIKNWWKRIAKQERADIILLEIGGTVGDIENELYIEAARQLKHDVGAENTLYIHLTYVPTPSHVGEQKSKPTQQSVQLLRERGITPDIIIGRSRKTLDKRIKEKIAKFCDVPKEAVISGVDVPTVYEIPLIFKKEGLHHILKEKLRLTTQNNKTWECLVNQLHQPTQEITIAVCGKYTKLEDSYASIAEAITHCAAHTKTAITLTWIDTSKVATTQDAKHVLKDADGVIVPGGFGTRGVEGKIKVIEHCRTTGTPFLGICYGMQLAVVEYARNQCGIKDANTEEVSGKQDDVVCILPEQRSITNKGGTMRLGGHDVLLKKGTRAYHLFGKQETIRRRFRHRYEINPAFIDTLQEHGLVFSGKAPTRPIMQILELPDHPYFMASQFHPELTSGLLEPSPLFLGLVQAAIKNRTTPYTANQ